MSPIIEAALISGGWAAVVAALGFYFNRALGKANIKAASDNAMLALDAAHAAQLWEKQASAYVDSIREIDRRLSVREHQIRLMRYDEATEENLQSALDEMKNPDWAAAAARLRAYASPSVLDAKRAADDADRTVISRFLDWQGATEMNRNAIERARLGVPADIPDGHVAMEALQAVRQAADAASAADEALRAAIWDDMHTMPSLRQNAPSQNTLPGAERPQLPPV